MPDEPGEDGAVMETMSQAIARLERGGYRDSFQAQRDGLRALDAGRLFAPEELVVADVVRFEGESDPEDQAVLFALHSRDEKVRGTFVAAYGLDTDPDCAEMMRRLALASRHRG